MFSASPCQQNRCMIRETLGDGEGRRFVEEAAFVHGYAAGTNTWDIQCRDRVTA